jgi:hypothetical protein
VKQIVHRATAVLRRRRAPEPARPYADLVRRIEYLEAALEGLQDAVYRQDVVHDRQIADLRSRKRP